MTKLLHWSHHHDDHPILLSFAYLTEHGTTVDLFSVAPGSRSSARELFLGRERVPTRQDAERDRYAYDSTVENIAGAAAARAARIENELYTDALRLGDAEVTREDLLGMTVAGSWTPLNLFGESQRYLFLGTLSGAPDRDAFADFHRGRDARRAPDRMMDVDVTSRIVVGITTQPAARPPDPGAVREAVERG